MLKIRELYPDNLVAVAIEDVKNQKWGAALNQVEEGELGRTIYALNGYTYDTDGEALKALDQVVRFVVESMKIMSN